MVDANGWKLHVDLLGANPMDKTCLFYYEVYLGSQLFRDCRKSLTNKAITDGCEALARFHLAKAYAHFNNNWKIARQQLLIALDLTSTATFYDYRQKVLNGQDMKDRFLRTLALIEYCGFHNVYKAVEHLKKIKSAHMLHKAHATWGRILIETGAAQDGLKKFTQADPLKLLGRDMLVFSLLLKNEPLPQRLMLSALDLYD